MTFPVDALLVDFDGVIVDSESADAAAWLEEWDRAAVPLSMRQYAAYWAGWSWLRLVPMITRLAGAAPGTDTAEVEARRRVRWEKSGAGLLARPGIADWIETAAGEGLPVAVVTNDVDGRVPAALERLGLARHVTAVVTAADGNARRKPAPDLYRVAASRLGVGPSRAVAVEDSPHGATAAWDAGLAGVINTPNDVTRLIPASDWVEEADPARVPLGIALDNALLRGRGWRGKGGGQERGTAPAQASWAAASRAYTEQDPWHLIADTVLSAVADVAGLDETRPDGPPTLPRLPLLLQSLAFWRAALVTGTLYPGDVPAQLAIDLLTHDQAAVETARTIPVRAEPSPHGRPGDPALLPADRELLQRLPDTPAWDDTRRAALQQLTAAAGACMNTEATGIPVLGTLSGSRSPGPFRWTDDPDEAGR